MTRRAPDRAERLYARFVALYPRRFRDEYGDALRQVFRELLDDPTVPRWRVWLAVIADIPGSLLPEYVTTIAGRTEMDIAHWTRNASVRRGIAAGFALGLVWTVYNAINNALDLDARGYALLNNGQTAALVLLFGFAGFAGTRRAGTVRAGTSAGVVAALVGSVIGIATLWLATWMFFARIQHNTGMLADFQRSGAASMDTFIIEDTLGASCFGALLALPLGALFGTVGGLLARATMHLRAR